MSEEDARYFADKMESFLDIPSFVCELIEENLVDGNYRMVCEYVVQRKREIEGAGE